MQLGIISDTHNILPQSIIDHFKGVDYIFHAGDIGQLTIIYELKKIAPVIAVHGNIDTGNTKREIPALYYNNLSGHEICMIHDIGNIKNFSYELFKQGKKPELVIYGHTHKPNLQKFQKTLFLNPGSASYPRLEKQGSIALVTYSGDHFSHQFIWL